MQPLQALKQRYQASGLPDAGHFLARGPDTADRKQRLELTPGDGGQSRRQDLRQGGVVSRWRWLVHRLVAADSAWANSNA